MISFTYGGMRSGKTAMMILYIYSQKARGRNVQVLKPSIDTREVGVIRSRALDTEFKALTFKSLEELDNILKSITNEKVDEIYVDEGQFISSECIIRLVKFSHDNDIDINFYGLKNSFTGELFDGSKTLIEYADIVKEIESRCDMCNRNATMHLRSLNGEFVFDGDIVSVGDEEYYSVCGKCFLDKKLSQG